MKILYTSSQAHCQIVKSHMLMCLICQGLPSTEVNKNDILQLQSHMKVFVCLLPCSILLNLENSSGIYFAFPFHLDIISFPQPFWHEIQ